MDPATPARALKQTAEKTAQAAADKVADLLESPVPGAPGSGRPPLGRPR